jgi:hypothetical protein
MEVTVSELQKMCAAVIAQREVVNKAEDEFKALDKELTRLENELILTLQAQGLDSFKEGGYQFIRTAKMSVALPQGEHKDAFFDYLKSIGQFEALATVHSRTLNSWYNQEKVNAFMRGEMLMIPGLELPTERAGLTVRKSN